ncbi:type I polyketide synthase [Nonomuraea sp. NPDC050227]|uniref:type I polyketide synthase n=1 Tax=Nonomuraea sp. NPDC050227 TaxID=3364360 RepID=UPI0037ABD59C
MEVPEHYAALRRRGIQQSGPFRSVTALRRAEGAAAAEVRADDGTAADQRAHLFHPALLDSALQPVMTLLGDDTAEDTYLPVATRRYRVHARPEPGTRLWSTAVRVERPEPDVLEFDVRVSDDEGRLLASVDGFRIRRLVSELPEVVEHRAARLLHAMEWAELPPLTEPAAEGDHWLVVSGSPLGAELCARVAAAGGRPLLIRPGTGYRRPASGRRTLDLASAEDWRLLAEERTAEGAWPPRGVVVVPAPPSERVRGSAALEGCHDVLSVVQALGGADSGASPRLWLVTTAAHALDGDTDVVPAQTAVWGLGRVVPYEHPELRCSLVDLPAAPDASTVAALVAEMVNDGPETEIALRPGRRHTSRLRRRPLPAAGPVPVRPDGTYLIAGGFGGVGLLTAEWLVGRGARDVVLVGRSGAPADAEERMAAMRAAGARVHPVVADIASRQDLAELLDDLARRLPPLRGVVNSAVVLDDGTLAQLDRKRFFAPMPPKVEGSWQLHELTRHLPLDFFLLYSSAASVIGSPGQGNYSAANGYQDGLAWHRHAAGLPALSVNWGQWAATGQVAKAANDLRLDERGFAGFAPAEGLAVLDRLLADPPVQASVMSFDPVAWTRHFPALRGASALRELVEGEQVTEEQGAGPVPGLLAAEDDEQALRIVTAYLCAQVAAVVQLPLEEVGAGLRPHRMGLDSLMAVQLRNRIAADLGVTLPVAVFLQRRTIEELAALALTHLREQAGAPEGA